MNPSTSQILTNTEDAMQIIYGGTAYHIFQLDELAEDFFKLENGLAGEVFQKFVNYRFAVAFIVPENHNLGLRVTQLMRDHKNHPFVRFYEHRKDAIIWLESQ